MSATLDGLTTAEAARSLRLSEQTIRNLVRSGKLASVRTPLGSVIDPVAVAQLAAEREQAAVVPRIRVRQLGRRPPERNPA